MGQITSNKATEGRGFSLIDASFCPENNFCIFYLVKKKFGCLHSNTSLSQMALYQVVKVATKGIEFGREVRGTVSSVLFIIVEKINIESGGQAAIGVYEGGGVNVKKGL